MNVIKELTTVTTMPTALTLMVVSCVNVKLDILVMVSHALVSLCSKTLLHDLIYKGNLLSFMLITPDFN